MSRRAPILIILFCVLFAAPLLFFIIRGPRTALVSGIATTTALAQGTSTSTRPSVATTTPAAIKKNIDIGPQPHITPPTEVKAIYATSWSASSRTKLDYLIKLIKDTELNAIVLDIKDYTGYVSYNTELLLPKKYDAVELRTPQLNTLLKRFHDEGIYTIARIAVFQDVRLVKARPDLALTSSSTGEVWGDYKGVTWLDTASKEVWDYNIAIAREAYARGFDEINFDYVRFPSDGNLDDIRYPLYDGKKLKVLVLRDFFKYLREQLPEVRMSIDLFGLVTVSDDGLGIGQKLDYAFPYFDAIAPMVYPSHFAKGFKGFENPAARPYEVIRHSMEGAIARVYAYDARVAVAKASTTTPPVVIPPDRRAVLRPWLQDFDLGADYDALKVRAQINAWTDAATTTTRTDLMNGWMLWSPSNIYTKGALFVE